MKEGTITIFTDGSSRGNPGPGGWGAILIYPVEGGFKVTELGGREEHTTNNRMELSAVKEALAFIEKRKLEGTIEINTDSAYLLQGVTGWMYGWEKNGWKTKTGEDVLNQDIWKEIGGLVFRMKQKRELVWNKVSGHTGHIGNERADMIATNAADQGQQLLFTGSLADYEKLLGGSVAGGIDADKVAAKAKKNSSSKPAYSYVSMVDGILKTHRTWSECEARVKGTRGARFRKVFSKDEEASLMKEWTEASAGSK